MQDSINYIQTEQWPWPHPEPGVYFGMPHDLYLSVPAISSSGIKDLLVSGPNFWANSWMNPFRAEKNKQHFVHGKAYHKRILEGRAAFYDVYAPAWEDPNTPDIIRNVEQLRGELAHLGLPTTFKSKDQGIARLLKAAPQKKIADVLIAAHNAKHAGKELLPPSLIAEIEMSAKSIESSQYLSTWLAGGQPEVSVFFYSKQGFLLKSRFDYLKIGAVIDLKTFANEKARRIDKAIDYAISGNKYFIQSGFYLNAAERARELMERAKIHNLAHEMPQKSWINAFAKTPVSQFRWIFTQKDCALVSCGKIHDVANQELNKQSNERIRTAVDTFSAYYKAYGDGVWVLIDPPQHVDYLSLPSFAGDL